MTDSLKRLLFTYIPGIANGSFYNVMELYSWHNSLKYPYGKKRYNILKPKSWVGNSKR
jgi:hypothetical protein